MLSRSSLLSTSFFLDKSGNVYVTGRGSAHQTGLGHINSIYKPTMIPGLKNVQAVAPGYEHVLFLTESGELYIVGDGLKHIVGNDTFNNITQLDVPNDDPIIKIASGFAHSIVITKSGKAYGIGVDQHGELGIPHPDKSKPNIGYKTLHEIHVDKDVCVVDAACGKEISLFLTSNGEVYSCGTNMLGELGIVTNTIESIHIPRKLQFGNGATVKYITCGTSHCAAVTTDKKLYTWGRGSDGQLGLGDTVCRYQPSFVQVSGVLGVACGWSHMLIVTENPGGAGHKVYTWGLNSSGQLADSTGVISKSPMLLEGFTGSIIKEIACGNCHTFIHVDGKGIQGWGFNGYGQLGLADAITRAAPTTIPDTIGLGIHRIRDMDVGAKSKFYLKDLLFNDGYGACVIRFPNHKITYHKEIVAMTCPKIMKSNYVPTNLVEVQGFNMFLRHIYTGEVDLDAMHMPVLGHLAELSVMFEHAVLAREISHHIKNMVKSDTHILTLMSYFSDPAKMSACPHFATLVMSRCVAIKPSLAMMKEGMIDPLAREEILNGIMNDGVKVILLEVAEVQGVPINTGGSLKVVFWDPKHGQVHEYEKYVWPTIMQRLPSFKQLLTPETLKSGILKLSPKLMKGFAVLYEYMCLDRDVTITPDQADSIISSDHEYMISKTFPEFFKKAELSSESVGVDNKLTMALIHDSLNEADKFDVIIRDLSKHKIGLINRSDIYRTTIPDNLKVKILEAIIKHLTG